MPEAGIPKKQYWPYDELTAAAVDPASGMFDFSTPWVRASVKIRASDVLRTQGLVAKMASGDLRASDLSDITWLFSSLAQHPLAYLLPRADARNAEDHHSLKDTQLFQSEPAGILQLLSLMGTESSAFLSLVPRVPENWTWDAGAALQFSMAPGTALHDPQSLFSVVRRFHLIDSVAANRTDEMLDQARALRGDPEKFKKGSALVVRQNQYVTQKCDSTLRPALALAQNATAQVQAFIRAEAGHDVLLGRAMKALQVDADQVPVLNTVQALMEVFRIAAERNFLAFTLIVDMFERSSYRDEDPLAKMLNDGGQTEAGRQIDIHREINDSGGHENVALGFLETMAPVDSGYATEALRLAELATWLIHTTSTDLQERLKTL